MIRVNSPDGLKEVAESLISLFDEGFLLLLLYGEMGSGKTTLVKALCGQLGVMEPVTSPTFSIIQDYYSPSRGIIHHMDFYRLENSRELERIGLEEYLDSGNLCFIEWPETGMRFYPGLFIRVDILLERDNIRNFKITTDDTVDA